MSGIVDDKQREISSLARTVERSNNENIELLLVA
jgi:hypothetical protein